MLLKKSTIFRSDDLDKIVDFVQTTATASVHSPYLIDKSGDGFLCNKVSSNQFDIFYVANRLSTNLTLHPVDYIRLIFPIEGTSRLIVDGHEIVSASKGEGHIFPEGVSVETSHPQGFESLTLRLDPAALSKKLVTMTGTDIGEKVTFKQPADLEFRVIRFLRQAVFNGACEIDTIDPIFHAHVLDELNSTVLTRLLLHARHNYSHLLEKNVPDAGFIQMKQVEDYIYNNLDSSLNIERLASVAGVSGRTVLRQFHKKHGTTPYDYIRKIRLDKARQLLLESNQDSSVLSIALSCGFRSFGHFADLYQRRFGELPSVTIKKKH